MAISNYCAKVRMNLRPFFVKLQVRKRNKRHWCTGYCSDLHFISNLTFKSNKINSRVTALLCSNTLCFIITHCKHSRVFETEIYKPTKQLLSGQESFIILPTTSLMLLIYRKYYYTPGVAAFYRIHTQALNSKA